jgi:hypothetical protein
MYYHIVYRRFDLSRYIHCVICACSVLDTVLSRAHSISTYIHITASVHTYIHSVICACSVLYTVLSRAHSISTYIHINIHTYIHTHWHIAHSTCVLHLKHIYTHAYKHTYTYKHPHMHAHSHMCNAFDTYTRTHI